MRLRHLFVVSVAASIVLTVPGGPASAAPSVDSQLVGATTVVDDPPDVEIPSDPEELPPPQEATITEKADAGLLAGIPESSWEEYAKDDYLYTTELWRRAAFDTEVRAGAELAIGTYDPETRRCDACTSFIRTNIHLAHDRDVRKETLDRARAHAARDRRQAVARMVDYVFPNDSAIGSSDRNFIFTIWEHLRATKPWATQSIPAAAASVTASPEERVDFLSTFGARYFYPDQAQYLIVRADGDEAKLKDLARRAKRKAAGIEVGVSFGPPNNEDEKYYLVKDDLFLEYLYEEIKDDDLYKICANEIAIVLGDEGPAEWLAFIEGGITAAVQADKDRLAAERLEATRIAVTAIRDGAVAGGFKNIARAGTAALAKNTLRSLIDFQDNHDKLPPDAGDMTMFYDYGTAPSGIWVFGRVGRKAGSGTVRRVWTGPAGWRALNAQPVLGEFDKEPGQDAAVLYKVANMSYRLEVFSNAQAPSGPPATVWELKPTSAVLGYTLQAPVATDVDGDGRTDIAVYGTDPGRKPILITLYNEANGTFRSQILSVPAALVTGRVTAGDVNGDGRGDLVTLVQHATKGAQMWLGVAGTNGYGAPAERWSSTSVKLADTGTPVIGDFDRDGKAEVALFRKESTTASLWLHDNIATGTVSFAKKWTSPAGWTFDALYPVATDVNGDARTDLAVMQRNDAAKASVWSIRAKSGGFESAVSAWTSAKGSWRTANTRIAR